MKRILILFVVLAIVFAGCQSNEPVPENTSREIYQWGKESYEIGQKYADGEISDEEAAKKLDTLYKDADEYVKKEKPSEIPEAATDWEEEDYTYLNDLIITQYIGLLNFYVNDGEKEKIPEVLEGLGQSLKLDEKTTQ